MPSIIEPGFDELVAALPEWSALNFAAERPSLLIAAVGFEDRTIALTEEWLSTSPSHPGAILIRYRTNAAENRPNLERFRQLLTSRDVPVEEIDYDQRTISTQLARAIGTLGASNGLLLDVSTMASFVMYPVLRTIFDTSPRGRLTVGYVEAQTYYPERQEWETFWNALSGKDIVERADLFERQYFQSRGAERVYEAMHFVGRNPSDLPVKLIMIPNFSFHRVFNMREHVMRNLNVDQADVEWIIGEPLDADKNGWRAEAVYKLCNKPKCCEYCSTFNYKDLLNALHTLWEKYYTNHAITVATLGSKAQHIATFLFLLMHQEVSLVLSEPEAFVTDRFSKGVGTAWQLKFGEIRQVFGLLAGWRHLRFAWSDQLKTLET